VVGRRAGGLRDKSGGVGALRVRRASMQRVAASCAAGNGHRRPRAQPANPRSHLRDDGHAGAQPVQPHSGDVHAVDDDRAWGWGAAGGLGLDDGRLAAGSEAPATASGTLTEPLGGTPSTAQRTNRVRRHVRRRQARQRPACSAQQPQQGQPSTRPPILLCSTCSPRRQAGSAASPPSSSTMRKSARNREDLPLPVRPTSPTFSPALMLKLTPGGGGGGRSGGGASWRPSGAAGEHAARAIHLLAAILLAGCSCRRRASALPSQPSQPSNTSRATTATAGPQPGRSRCRPLLSTSGVSTR
jgi:hypothetical protein